VLKVAVLDACAQPGRAFAPAVGEIRAAALKLSTLARAVPNEFEAWAEVCRMPKDRLRSRIQVDENGQMVTGENGAVIILQERLKWSHALVERTAVLMGWPEFPGEDESLDRAHFFQAYRTGLSRMMEDAGELPGVRDYVLAGRTNASLPTGQALKKLVKWLEK